jgi:hypothetical protein
MIGQQRVFSLEKEACLVWVEPVTDRSGRRHAGGMTRAEFNTQEQLRWHIAIQSIDSSSCFRASRGVVDGTDLASIDTATPLIVWWGTRHHSCSHRSGGDHTRSPPGIACDSGLGTKI